MGIRGEQGGFEGSKGDSRGARGIRGEQGGFKGSEERDSRGVREIQGE